MQVVNNLINNAIQFTEAPGTVTIALGGTPDLVELRIADTGVGIETDFLEHVFEPFRQAPQTLARASGGLGLGLALVQQIVLLLGGRVAAESRGPGQGATFTVVLPRTEPRGVLTPPRSTPPVGPLRILVVEDNGDTAEMMALMLEMAGHEVTIASDAQLGLEVALERTPDVILCDIGLPGDMDGYGFAQCIREQGLFKPAALISISGYGRPEDAERAKRAGFDLHLAKPIDLASLERTIGRLLAPPPAA
jgi:CheY-like chemotaxis protein/anti-sigma regulatory factor (Ser/Thr protein kinase)